jgi:hypothetical protein
MPDTHVAKKLQIKPGSRVLALHAPPGYREALGPLPEGAELAESPGGSFDVVHLFVGGQADLRRDAAAAIGAVRPGGVLWISYPKRSSKVDTDLTRDAGWEPVGQAGWQAVSQISVDPVWSALRFRPIPEGARVRPPGHA